MQDKKIIWIAVVLALFVIIASVYYSYGMRFTFLSKQNEKLSESENLSATQHLSASEFKIQLDAVTDKLILDVRTDPEYRSGHIEGAVNIDFYSPDFKDKLSQLDKSKTYFIYCRSGNRSGQVVKIMEELGFADIRNLKFGIKDWVNNGLPLLK